MSGRRDHAGRGAPDAMGAAPRRGCTWLGDLALALETIAPQDEGTARRIARLLGLGPSSTTGPQDTGPAWSADAPPEHTAATAAGKGPELPATGEERGSTVPTMLEGLALDPEDPGQYGAVDAGAVGGGTGHPRLSPLETLPAWPRGWSRPGVGRPDRELMSRRPTHTPLLAPLSTAALLEAALAGTAPEGEVEIETTVDFLARGLPLTDLPRRMLRTLRHGVQILVDHGPAMQLFSRDQMQLCERVEALVGKEKTELLRFAYAPLRGAGKGPFWTWRTYQPPPRGSAVLLLSDCGTIGPPGDHRRSRPAEWREFAAEVRRHGARPLGLLPLPRDRFPAWLPATMPVFAWDRGTTVGHVTARVAPAQAGCGANSALGGEG
ncbi:hypothetical protein [Streptomyces sp. NPDC058572]|uniref:hypothetical protein n=1 Tax=Streptomyces sp. NPDC058572 TaxID=3346546 RepID=UPI0036625409